MPSSPITVRIHSSALRPEAARPEMAIRIRTAGSKPTMPRVSPNEMQDAATNSSGLSRRLSGSSGISSGIRRFTATRMTPRPMMM